MDFCEKCGGMILFDDKKAACASCGYKPKKNPKIQVSEKIEKTGTVAVIKEDSEEGAYPIVDVKCEKCKKHIVQWHVLDGKPVCRQCYFGE